VIDDISISAGASIQQDLNKILAHEYNIRHATLQLECEGCNENILFCNISEHQHEHTEVSKKTAA
jgi:cobalt-zinc-cadmium efflux system protein